ncbi:MAG: helix-turn-helix domain-containing protein [Desulfovibrionales bacterium]|nr:helix-turn-helix domain-containing protein [Desulfovibrionales bacterium]
MKITFGQALKNLRREKKVSQRELANGVGVDFSYISKIENDRLPPPSADTIIKICKILEIPSEVLLAQSGKVSSDIKEIISSSEEAIRFLNEAQQMRLTDDDWRKLSGALKKLR